ncbi:STM3941 family protein [Arenimonas sp. MALMAid1274]|uniref:STM3941 family protein n=1 Tax=Arenimonas sp. MALMAid1274 TaxID=3411630 RepID=UPI003B9E4223
MTLKPRLSRFVLLLLVCAAFVALGIFLVLRGQMLLGWLNVGFFGLGVAVAAISLLPGSNYLRLSRDGFEVCSLYRRGTVRWRDVQAFFPAEIARRPLVCWNYADDYDRQRAGRLLATELAGVEAALPDTYGLSADALAQLLNQWRARSLDASNTR